MSSLHFGLLVCFFVTMALMLFVGARLLLVARRTLRAPEAGIGSSAFFGALGVLLLLVATTILGREPSAFPVWAAGVVGMGLGSSGLFVACWRIYRPAAPIAAAPAAVGAAIALSGCALRIFPGSIPPPIEPSIGQLLMQSASLGAYGWATVEAFHYHRKLRRRLRLGLADPVLTHRFWLWGVSGACAFGSSAIALVVVFWVRGSLLALPVPFAIVQLLLLVAAVGLWLAFFPPSWYLHVVADRADAIRTSAEPDES